MMSTLFLLFITATANAAPAYLYDANGNPITSTAGALNVAGSITASNPSVGTNSAAAPTSSTQVAGQDTLGNLKPLKLNASQAVTVDGSAVTQPVSGSVTANIGTTNGLALDASVNAQQVSQSSTSSGQKGNLVQGAVTTAAPTYITGQTNPLSLTPAGALRTDASAVTQPVSGTFWQATQPVSAAALPLPTGAATAAKQPALGTAGAASADVISIQGIASMTPLKVDGSAVTQPVSGTFWQATQPVSVASAIPTKSPVNTNGNFAQITTLTNVAQTLTAPANAVGFILESYSGNANNIRFAVGATATTTAGFVLEPGRDTGFVPEAANISVIAVAGTNQEVDVQWVLSQ